MIDYPTALWTIRVAARLWLRDHPGDPEAENVKAALLVTNQEERPDGDELEEESLG
jgi:hypothetical protein